MTLDDVYGPEHDRFPLEQERAPVVRTLEWSDATDWRAVWRRTPCGRALDAATTQSPLAVLLQAPRRAA